MSLIFDLKFLALIMLYLSVGEEMISFLLLLILYRLTFLLSSIGIKSSLSMINWLDENFVMLQSLLHSYSLVLFMSS